MNNFEAHGKCLVTFRKAHAAMQTDIAGQEPFGEHDARMKAFQHNHPDTELAAPNLGKSQPFPERVEWSTLIPLDSTMWLGFSAN